MTLFCYCLVLLLCVAMSQSLTLRMLDVDLNDITSIFRENLTSTDPTLTNFMLVFNLGEAQLAEVVTVTEEVPFDISIIPSNDQFLDEFVTRQETERNASNKSNKSDEFEVVDIRELIEESDNDDDDWGDFDEYESKCAEQDESLTPQREW